MHKNRRGNPAQKNKINEKHVKPEDRSPFCVCVLSEMSRSEILKLFQRKAIDREEMINSYAQITTDLLSFNLSADCHLDGFLCPWGEFSHWL